MEQGKLQRRIGRGMRVRLTLVFLVCFGLMAVVTVLQLRASLLPRCSALEQKATSDDMARLIQGLTAELSYLERLNRDWLPFHGTLLQNLLDNKLQPAARRNNATSMIAIFDRRGERLASLSVARGQSCSRSRELFAAHPARMR